ncbi:hypothetical protein PYK79_05585 [Streptomyces sp. ID05-04B]|uniref:hypothetical protein n=1 Tax=unclassified Streptomyces TaxID=2593676 RepID=UPI000D1B66EA|nr:MULTISPECIES: hypothetical protein [unclassified Streptomyces]AVV44255.1 hypothetical protein C6376_25255 [Streptomyces sp. P3]MDX5563025.1 hypothetical protein [Streptomyces sp. ID05-04B]
MGVYLVSVDARDWFGQEEGGHGETASALNEELRRRGLPPYLPAESATRARHWFEEKASPSMAGFAALCRAHLTPAEQETLLGWTVLVPVSLDRAVELPIGSAYVDETLVAGAPQVLALAERLAQPLGLPLDAIPETGGNLEMTHWFLEGEASAAAAARPGPWADDPEAAFYVALYLRAARYALRHGCPMTWS